MQNKPEGRIPIEDLPNWISALKDSKIKQKDFNKFVRHHYYENVRSAMEDGLSLEQFIFKLTEDILKEFPQTDQAEIADTNRIISNIWTELKQK
jgi:hypothetical protein